jgi:hypothetical protein
MKISNQSGLFPLILAGLHATSEITQVAVISINQMPFATSPGCQVLQLSQHWTACHGQQLIWVINAVNGNQHLYCEPSLALINVSCQQHSIQKKFKKRKENNQSPNVRRIVMHHRFDPEIGNSTVRQPTVVENMPFEFPSARCARRRYRTILEMALIDLRGRLLVCLPGNNI